MTFPPPKMSNKNSQAQSNKASSKPSGGYSFFDQVFLHVTFTLALVAVCASLKLALDGKLKVLQPKSISLTSLETFSGKLEFTAKYWILPVLWLYFFYHVVIFKRVSSKAINPLSGHESEVQDAKNILTNSIEQFVLLTFSQTISLAFISPIQTLQLIPLANLWFVVGRVLFWLGYPKKRTFGMISSAIPGSIAIWYSTYYFFTQFIDPAQLLSFTSDVIATKTATK